MKLTKETLKQIIKEELDAFLAEDTLEEGDTKSIFDSLVDEYIQRGMNPMQAYEAAASERPDLAQAQQRDHEYKMKASKNK